MSSCFFKVGKRYCVVVPRIGAPVVPHWFDRGAIVTCVDITIKNKNCSIKGNDDFKRENYSGSFIGPDGFAQTLYTGNVVACSI